MRSRWSVLKAMSDKCRSFPGFKEAITVGKIAAKVLGYTRDKRELTNRIEVFMTSTRVFEVLLAALETICVYPTCHCFL